MTMYKHYVVFKKENIYASFPSICQDNDGVLYVALRKEPKRKSKTHINTQSTILLLKSRNEGEHWRAYKEISKADNYCGLQDPTISIIKDKMFLTYYEYRSRKRKHTKSRHKVDMLGLTLQVSNDRGSTWYNIKHVLGSGYFQLASRCPLLEIGDKLVLVGYGDNGGGGLASFIVCSNDNGENWEFPKKIAHDNALNYTEPWLLDCGNDHWLCLIRAEANGNSTYQVHTWDAGDSWEPPRKIGFSGFPSSLLKLKDGRILATYGVRSNPYGIRACLSYDNGISWDTGNEVNVRLDGGGWDVGYPQTVQLAGGNLLTVYYLYTKLDKTRGIYVTKWSLDD